MVSLPLLGIYIGKSLISYWSWRELSILCATIAAGVACCLSGRTRRPRLTLVPIFGLYEAILNAVLFCVALKQVPNHNYWMAWSCGAILENALLILVAIEIVCTILPAKRAAQAWCTGLALLAILSAGNLLPIKTQAAVLNVTLAGDFIAALVLLCLLYFPIRWPRGYPQIIAGVVLPAAAHAACAVNWLHGELTTLVQAVLPLASLIGLLLFLAGNFAAKAKGLISQPLIPGKIIRPGNQDGSTGADVRDYITRHGSLQGPVFATSPYLDSKGSMCSLFSTKSVSTAWILGLVSLTKNFSGLQNVSKPAIKLKM